jgi:A/G-specific adenine glycosylase
MLQQTRVAAAIPYFQRWMERWSTAAAAAAAPEEEILLLWAGLGYYARARNLHRLCQILASSAPLPASPEEWCRLPGVGPYTAAAICSLAGLADAVPLDGNGLRILARLRAIRTPFASRQILEKTLRPLANSLAVPGRGGAIGEALMDLGSAICLPRNPLCELCPIRGHCPGAREAEESKNTPLLLARPRREETVHRLWLWDGKMLWLQRSSRRRLRHFYELPLLEIAAADPSPANLTQMDPSPADVLLVGRRTIGSVRYREVIHGGTVPANPDALEAISGQRLDAVPIPGPHRRWIRTLLQAESLALQAQCRGEDGKSAH